MAPKDFLFLNPKNVLPLSMRRNPQDFRLYYNQVITPELIRQEKRRKLLVLFSSIAMFVFILIGFFVFYLKIPALLLFFWIPVFFYGTYVGYRIQVFKNQFKPKIVSLVLQFISKDLSYKHDYKIPFDRFIKSGLFQSEGEHYNGEDYIQGRLGEVNFELCELDVKKLSRVRNNMQAVFRGVFFHAHFNDSMKGRIVILPKEDQQTSIRTIKAITKQGGGKIELKDMRFEAYFIAYADEGTPFKRFLNPEVIEDIIAYREKTGKKIYFSLIDGHMHLGIDEPKDILEPNILSTNLNFKVIHEFYKDIAMVTDIVHDFDLHH